MESAVITDTTGGRVCLKCSFSSFSTDTGCTVELVSDSVNYTETINRSGNDTAEGCVSGITRGQYVISVYDQSSSIPVLKNVGVNVTEKRATTTTTIGEITTSTHGTHDSATRADEYSVNVEEVSILTIHTTTTTTITSTHITHNSTSTRTGEYMLYVHLQFLISL